MTLSPRAALAERVRECIRRFRYIPDAEGLFNDVWNEPEATELAGGGDCDDLAVWTAVRGYEMALGVGRWRIVRGRVKQHGEWLGHVWNELIDVDGARLWSDPTWRLEPATPEWFGGRRAEQAFEYDGNIFQGPIDYIA